MSAPKATTTSSQIARQENAAPNQSIIPDEEIIWTPRQIQQLIRAFRNEPLLWDVRLRTHRYTERGLRSESWNRISFLLKVSRNECERKMCSLLAQYRRERIRQNRIRAGLLTRRKRKWFGYDWFEFITKMHTHQLQSQSGDLILKTEAGESPSPTPDELAQVTFDQDSNHSRRDTFQLPDSNGIAWVIAPKHQEASTPPSQPMEQDPSEDECDDEKLGESSSNPTEMLDLAIWSDGSMERSKERAAAVKEKPSSSLTSSMSSLKTDERSGAHKPPKKEKIIMLDNEKQFATSRRNQKVVMLPPPEPPVIRTCNIAPTSVAKKPQSKVIFISPSKQLAKKDKKSRLKNKIFRTNRTVLQQNVPSGFPKWTVKKICDNDKNVDETIIIPIVYVKDEPIDGDSETVPITSNNTNSAPAPNITAATSAQPIVAQKEERLFPTSGSIETAINNHIARKIQKSVQQNKAAALLSRNNFKANLTGNYTRPRPSARNITRRSHLNVASNAKLTRSMPKNTASSVATLPPLLKKPCGEGPRTQSTVAPSIKPDDSNVTSGAPKLNLTKPDSVALRKFVKIAPKPMQASTKPVQIVYKVPSPSAKPRIVTNTKGVPIKPLYAPYRKLGAYQRAWIKNAQHPKVVSVNRPVINITSPSSSTDSAARLAQLKSMMSTEEYAQFVASKFPRPVSPPAYMKEPATDDSPKIISAPGYPIVVYAQDYPRTYTPEEWERKQQLERARKSKEQDSTTVDSKQERPQHSTSKKESMFRMHFNHSSTPCISGASHNGLSHSLGNLIVNKQDVNGAPSSDDVDKSVGSGAGATSTNSTPNKRSAVQLATNCNGFVPLFMLATEDSPPRKSAEPIKQEEQPAHSITIKVEHVDDDDDDDLPSEPQPILQTDEQAWLRSLFKVCTIGGQSVLPPSGDKASSPDSALGSPTHHDTGKLVPSKFSHKSDDDDELENNVFEPEVVLNLLTPADPEPSPDPDDIFSRYVVSSLRGMPKDKRDLCFDKIHEILGKPSILRKSFYPPTFNFFAR